MHSHNVAVVVTRNDAESGIRECLSAARAAGAGLVEIWLFGSSGADLSRMPADAVVSVPDGGDLVAERFVPAVARLVAERRCGVVLARDSVFGNALSVRSAFSLAGSCALSVSAIARREDGFAVVRREFGMQIDAELLYEQPPFFFSVLHNTYPPVEGTGSPAPVAVACDLPAADWYEDYEEIPSADEQGLEAYDFVLAGGRGLGGTKTAEKLLRLGRCLNAGVGGSRPAVLNAWLPARRMIGVSGALLKPSVCVAFGVSGCAPFLRGVEKSRLLVSVNSDPDALIFRHSDIGLVGDCDQALDCLLALAEGDPRGSEPH